MKKNIIKKSLLALVAVLSLGMQTTLVYATAVDDGIEYDLIETKIEPRTDIKEWIYAEINGSLYKRLYNYTRNRWEGDWILVQQGV